MKLFFRALLILFGTTLSCYSQWSSDPNTNTPVCTAPNDQQNVQITSDGNGGSIITWVDYNFLTFEYNISAQRLDPLGNPLWTANGIPVCWHSGDQTIPQIISDGSGGAIITWRDARDSKFAIYAQKLNSAGIPQWTIDGVVISSDVNDKTEEQLISDGAGGAILVWSDQRSGFYYDIYSQRINSGGNVLWTLNGVPICTAPLGQNHPKLLDDGSGGAFIVWEDYRSSEYNIYEQRINSSGAIQWTADGVEICSAPNDQYNPGIISDGSGGFILTWMDRRNTLNFDVYAQKVNSSGVAQWTLNGVAICTSNHDQNSVQSVSDNAGGAIIVWNDYRANSKSDIYCQKINSSGLVQWTIDGVPVSTAAEYKNRPEIISDGSGGAIITWEDTRDDFSHLYAQQINSSGFNLWTNDGIPASLASYEQYQPQILSNGHGGAIIVFSTSASSNDIFAQNTDSLLQKPSLSTTAPSAITIISAQSGGNISSGGGPLVTSRGLVWSTSTNPTTTSHSGGGISSDGSGIGSFTSNLSGLTGETFYYARSYATNSIGTSYGNEITFTTIPLPAWALVMFGLVLAGLGSVFVYRKFA